MRGDTPRVVILTVILVAICAPHAAEDFQFGVFARLGVAPTIPAAALGALFSMQVAGAYLVARRSPIGLALLIAAGAIWSIGAITLHGPEIIASGVSQWLYIKGAGSGDHRPWGRDGDCRLDRMAQPHFGVIRRGVAELRSACYRRPTDSINKIGGDRSAD